MKSYDFKAEALRQSVLATMLADVPKKVVDESSLTLMELAKASNLSRRMMHEYALKKVRDGKWERVWKMGSLRLVPAYRPKKPLRQPKSP